MIGNLISAVFQVLLFSVIPFLWWLVFARKEQSFFAWLGLKKPIIVNKKRFIGITILSIIILVVPTNLLIYYFVDSSLLATKRFAGRGFSAIIPILIYAILQTGLSEEIFFRGFLTKRLIHTYGFNRGNLIQSLVFGGIHGLMLVTYVHFIGVILIVIATSFAGYLMGWINEKKSNGSIISSWIIHSVVNIIAALLAMFNVL
ncbi:CAAX protease [Lysinibacillus contaminans]|uniref:CAAX protease n=1 Tax=Lysinibacillus contaminans TaxID=1293441 RepID=A0ABR5K1M2_9BACI|nr:CPBP family intramembrane glutamic endopeptidase [Lysinibacillus contaminans]KOS68635.1 CAAX protease [Lysinibacillus contaminans]